MREILVYPDAAATARAASDLVRTRLSLHKGSRRFALALSGGRTPIQLYRALAGWPGFGEMLNERAEVFFSDERTVPPESIESNYRGAFDHLLGPLAVIPKIVHRMRGEATDLAQEALRYEAQVREHVAAGQDQIPSFDLILLGMGKDGHVASLFPNSDVIFPTTRLVAEVWAESIDARRLTFTYALINAAQTVLFLAVGREKAEALKKVLSGGVEGNILPAGRIQAAETLWIVDKAAASLVDMENVRGTLKLC